MCSLLIHLPGVKKHNFNFHYIMILHKCRRVPNQRTAALLISSGRTWLRRTVTLHHSSSEQWWPIAACHSTWLTYLLTPWSRVLLEKLTASAASQEIPRIFGTRKFITVLTSARHLSLSWANSIQSPQALPTSWRSILISSSHLRLGLPLGLFPSGFPTRTLCTPLPCPLRNYGSIR